MKHLFTLLLIFISSSIFAQETPTKELDIIEINDEIGEVPFVVVENVPIYPGCDEKLSNAQLKRCMSSKIGALVGSEFDLSLASKLGLPAGFVRINATFKIDKDGKVIDIQARAKHPELEKEAERVLALLPDMIKPGIHKGQPVVVPYALPIKFAVTGDDKKEKKND